MLNPAQLASARDDLRATAIKAREEASNFANVARLAQTNGDAAIGRGARRVATTLGRSATALDELAQAMDEQAVAKA